MHGLASGVMISKGKEAKKQSLDRNTSWSYSHELCHLIWLSHIAWPHKDNVTSPRRVVVKGDLTSIYLYTGPAEVIPKKILNRPACLMMESYKEP